MAQILIVSVGGSVYTDRSIPEVVLGLQGSEKLRVVSEAPEVISVEDYFVEGQKPVIRLEGHKAGHASVLVYIEPNEEPSLHIEYRADLFHNVVNLGNGSFSNDRLYFLSVILYMVLLSVILWVGYIRSRRRDLYSYSQIFLSGYALWVSLATVYITVDIGLGYSVTAILSFLQKAGWIFMLFSSPFVLIFSIGLLISNVVLIRREGRNRTNLLGILVSALMLGGLGIGFALNYSFVGSELDYHLNNIVVACYTSIYVMFECFLIGSVISGARAALYVPPRDMDYIIILGCAIRKDGTLYPLLKGRVDRAIRFYREQLEQTGKKAVFVPSGGRGKDETISEGEAMRRYLISQGIPEEQILPETGSGNTIENMRFSKRLIEERSEHARVAFATTNYHVFRSGIISRQEDFYPYGMGAKTAWYFWPNAAIREILGMVYYRKRILLLILILLILLFVSIELFTIY